MKEIVDLKNAIIVVSYNNGIFMNEDTAKIVHFKAEVPMLEL